MTRQSKHIRFQVAHKAAQMIVEEGISDYAFAKRKAARFFGLLDGDTLPSNDEIKEALRTHQSIFLTKDQASRLKELRLESQITKLTSESLLFPCFMVREWFCGFWTGMLCF